MPSPPHPGSTPTDAIGGMEVDGSANQNISVVVETVTSSTTYDIDSDMTATHTSSFCKVRRSAFRPRPPIGIGPTTTAAATTRTVTPTVLPSSSSVPHAPHSTSYGYAFMSESVTRIIDSIWKYRTAAGDTAIELRITGAGTKGSLVTTKTNLFTFSDCIYPSREERSSILKRCGLAKNVVHVFASVLQIQLDACYFKLSPDTCLYVDNPTPNYRFSYNKKTGYVKTGMTRYIVCKRVKTSEDWTIIPLNDAFSHVHLYETFYAIGINNIRFVSNEHTRFVTPLSDTNAYQETPVLVFYKPVRYNIKDSILECLVEVCVDL